MKTTLKRCEAEVRAGTGRDAVYAGHRCSRKGRYVVEHEGRNAHLCGQHYRLKTKGGTVYLVDESKGET